MSDLDPTTEVLALRPPPVALVPRLGVMMFLQFFVWGAWYVSITGWLNEVGFESLTATVYSLDPFAALLSPLFLGMLADRFFASQRVLAALHFLGAIFLCCIPGFSSAHPTVFISLLLGHALCYMPTLGLTSAVAFHHLQAPEKSFPIVRVCGTVGWIVGNIAVTLLPGGDHSPGQFYLAAGAGVLLAIYSMSLPATPPRLKGRKANVRELFGLDAFRLLKDRNFLVFMVCAFLICIVLSGYYQQARNFVDFAQVSRPTLVMSLGQVSEIVFMLLLPLAFARLGIKWILLIAILAWALRYALFAGAADIGPAGEAAYAMILGGILLHGICYDFFFVAGQVYVDKTSPAEIRGQAQGLFVLVTWGVGMLLGAYAFGALFTVSPGWATLWWRTAGAAAVVAVVFVMLFRESGAGVRIRPPNPNSSSDSS